MRPNSRFIVKYVLGRWNKWCEAQRGSKMPWKVVKAKSGWDIIKSDTGKKVGHSATKAKAEASVRARYANNYKKK